MEKTEHGERAYLPKGSEKGDDQNYNFAIFELEY